MSYSGKDVGGEKGKVTWERTVLCSVSRIWSRRVRGGRTLVVFGTLLSYKSPTDTGSSFK